MREIRFNAKMVIIGTVLVFSLSGCKSAPFNLNASPQPSPVPSASGTPEGVGPGVGAENGSPQACTLEAKICPDGSAVGRTGPNCEFAACPESSAPQVSSAPGTNPILLPSDK